METTFIAGPCVIESAELLDIVAAKLVDINQRLGTDIIFKASYDKANRTSISSFNDIKEKYGLRILTDIHEAWQAEHAGQVVDVIQIPAFLCRQTDLLIAAARTGKTVNIKKAQFLSGCDMRYPVEKARDAGAQDIWLTERGNMMGYNNLVVDFRNIPDMLDIVPTALAAKAFGATGYFFEVHPDPDKGLSDAANMLELNKLESLIQQLNKSQLK